MRVRGASYDAEKVSDMCREIWSFPIAGALGLWVNVAVGLLLSAVVPLLGFGSMVSFILLAIGMPYLCYHLDVVGAASTRSDLAIPVGIGLALIAGFSFRAVVMYYTEVRLTERHYGVPRLLDLLQAVTLSGAAAFWIYGLGVLESLLLWLVFLLGMECGNIYALSLRTWKYSPQ
jgi:hypothetical protein